MLVVAPEPAEEDVRQAYFGEEHGWIDTPVLRRADLDLTSHGVGPILVEEYDATSLIPPGAHAELDATGNIVIESRRLGPAAHFGNYARPLRSAISPSSQGSSSAN